jgi:hypothetical protein
MIFNMSATNDFSRRLFADFIASRIKAWGLEGGVSRTIDRVPAPAVEDDPSRIETHAADAVEQPRGLLPGFGSSGA